MSTMTHASAAPNMNRVLCVDLDGTLVATDMLWESLLVMMKTKPWKLVYLPLWLLKGKAYLKQQIANHAVLNPATLPYHVDVLEFLKTEKARGREIVLATGSDRQLAEAVGQHVSLFSAIFASDGSTNLVGRQKLTALQNYSRGNGFDYLGNGKVDLALWKAANEALVVHPSRRLLRTIQRQRNIDQVFLFPRRHLAHIMQAIRVHQWVKNLLLFVPIALAHKLLESEPLLYLFFGFLSFSLCASSVYVLNDLLDLDSDRHHPDKKHRPFASGNLPISTGFFLIPLLLCGSFLIAILFLPRLFAVVLGLYLALTTAYSFYLKQLVIIDVLVLAGLYAVRIYAGAIVSDVRVSSWLLAFSIFMFLSLALIKRFSEITIIHRAREAIVNGRDYHFDDQNFVLTVGLVSGYLSSLVFMLYVNSPDVMSLYRNPQYLWLACPLLLYWITRFWLIVHRDPIVDDPIAFALKDPANYAVGGALALILFIAH